MGDDEDWPTQEDPEWYIDVGADHAIAALAALDESDGQDAAFHLAISIDALTVARLMCLAGPIVIPVS